MLNKCFAIFCSTALFLVSCQKDLKSNNAVLNTGSQLSDESSAGMVVDTTGHWVGSYAGSFGYTYPTIPDSLLIKDGIARDPQINLPFEFSNVSYEIPAQYNLSGDSITFEAKVKNTTDLGQYGYDIALQLFGEQHNAEVFFVGVQSGLSYSHYFVGDLRYNGLQPLVHYFDHFETIRLVMKNNSTAVYLDSTELYRFKYGTENSVGRLQKINVAFKGLGEVTKVGVRNSYGRRAILSEDFAFDGQSHVVYYHQ